MRKYQRIHIDIPQNIDERYKKLYQSKSSYRCPELGVKVYHNVFVSHEGLCWQYGRLLPYSSFNICTTYDKSFGWEYYKLVTEQYFVSTYGKSLKKITLDDDVNYAIIHTKWQNYSFWITSSLVRLLMLQNSGYDFTLLYPEEWDKIKYIQDSLKFFPSLKIKKIPIGVHVQVKNLLLPEVRPFTACFSGEELQMVHDYFVTRIPESYKKQVYPQRVYVTRKKAKFRKITNEAELITLCEKCGFVVIDFDDMSFCEQISCMCAAKYFISIHGAGYSNILFMEQGSHVLEIINEKYAELEYTFPFWKQAKTRGLIYDSIFAQPEKNTTKLVKLNTIDTSDALVNQNLLVDLQEFSNKLKFM